MASRPNLLSDDEVERLLGTLLRSGVVMAAMFVVAGAIVYLMKHGGATPAFAVFRGEPADLTSVPGIVRAAWSGQGQGLIQLGLLLLIATPIARVAFSLVAFVAQRDWLYMGVTAIVLSLLLVGLFGVPL